MLVIGRQMFLYSVSFLKKYTSKHTEISIWNGQATLKRLNVFSQSPFSPWPLPRPVQQVRRVCDMDSGFLRAQGAQVYFNAELTRNPLSLHAKELTSEVIVLIFFWFSSSLQCMLGRYALGREATIKVVPNDSSTTPLWSGLMRIFFRNQTYKLSRAKRVTKRIVFCLFSWKYVKTSLFQMAFNLLWQDILYCFIVLHLLLFFFLIATVIWFAVLMFSCFNFCKLL